MLSYPRSNRNWLIIMIRFNDWWYSAKTTVSIAHKSYECLNLDLVFKFDSRGNLRAVCFIARANELYVWKGNKLKSQLPTKHLTTWREKRFLWAVTFPAAASNRMINGALRTTSTPGIVKWKIKCIHTCHSRFIFEGVSGTAQTFLRDTTVLPKWLSDCPSLSDRSPSQVCI
jgi:hypothetical protein